MTIKNLFVLGSVLAGAAYLQDKGRRERVFGKARGLIDQAKSRASELKGKLESKATELTGSDRHDDGATSSAGSSSYSSFDSGVGSTRTYR
jgi:hypothetical protein